MNTGISKEEINSLIQNAHESNLTLKEVSG